MAARFQCAGIWSPTQTGTAAEIVVNPEAAAKFVLTVSPQRTVC
jgi:hypothetical protein